MKKHLKSYSLLIPAGMMVFIILIFPLIVNFYVSTQDWYFIMPDRSFIGLQNFTNILSSNSFIAAFTYSMFFTFTSLILCILMGLLAALYLSKTAKLQRVLTGFLLLPYMVARVASSLTWRLMLARYYGLIDHLFRFLFRRSAPGWLSTPWNARWVTVVVDVWREYPFAMLIFLAALSSIPKELYEAAEVDGATNWQTFRHITLPNLRPALTLILVFQTIVKLRVYDIPQALTGGGPGLATTSLGILVARINFRFMELGQAAALAIVLTAIGGIFIFIYMKWVYQEIEF